MYEVYIERRAEKDLRKLSPRDFSKVISRLKALGENPRPSGCRKIQGSKNDWRLKVGKFRIIYEIDDERKEIRIMRVRHRREAYR